jgi:hypothetical protein
MKHRWMYQASAIPPRCCILTSEIQMIAEKLGVTQEYPSSVFLTDNDVPLESIPVKDCKLTKTDMRENRRALLRWAVKEYGRDKATLKRLGLIGGAR